MKCGGISPAVDLIAEARRYELKVMLGCMVETSIAVTAAAQLSPLVDYAVAFAKRMAYEIVALNCAVMGGGAPAAGFNSCQSELFQEFQRKAAKGVEFLARRAVEEGVPLQHVVKAGPPDRCLRELEQEVELAKKTDVIRRMLNLYEERKRQRENRGKKNRSSRK